MPSVYDVLFEQEQIHKKEHCHSHNHSHNHSIVKPKSVLIPTIKTETVLDLENSDELFSFLISESNFISIKLSTFLMENAIKIKDSEIRSLYSSVYYIAVCNKYSTEYIHYIMDTLIFNIKNIDNINKKMEDANLIVLEWICSIVFFHKPFEIHIEKHYLNGFRVAKIIIQRYIEKKKIIVQRYNEQIKII